MARGSMKSGKARFERSMRILAAKLAKEADPEMALETFLLEVSSSVRGDARTMIKDLMFKEGYEQAAA